MTFFENKWPAIILWPLSLLYGAVTEIRNFLYDTGILPSVKINCPVISVGNLTVGGTGKTPTVITIARWLTGKNLRVAVVSRGYARESKGCVIVSDGKDIFASVKEAGDEPVLISQKLPGVPVLAFVNDYGKLPIHKAQDTMDLMSPDELAYSAQVIAAVVDHLSSGLTRTT